MLFRSIFTAATAAAYSGIATAIKNAEACKGAFTDQGNGAAVTTITQTITEVATVTVTLGAATTTQIISVMKYTTPCTTLVAITETPFPYDTSSSSTIRLTRTHTRTITSTVTDGTLTITTTVTVPSGGDPTSSGVVSTLASTSPPTEDGPRITAPTASWTTHTTTAYYSASSGTSIVATSTSSIATVANGVGKRAITLGSILSGTAVVLVALLG